MTIFKPTKLKALFASLLIILGIPVNAASFYSVSNPYMQIFNLQGTGLNTGKVYFGVAGQDPITNPITAYWDAAGTIPASQPIQTSGGYLYRSGSPAAIFLPSANPTYSIKVLDKNNATVYYQANVTPQPLSPITTTGDLIIGDGPYSETRLPIGANRTVLTSNGTTASWQSPAVVQYTCLNTSADQTNIDAIVTALKAANGGTVQLSAGTCLFDGIETTAGGEAPRVNFTGTGEYGATVVQAAGRANCVFTVRDFASVTNMRIKGTSTNTCGILLQYPMSTAFIQNVHISGFSGASAWAMDVDGTGSSGALRILIDHVYLIQNSHNLRLRGTVNDFKFDNSTISASTSTDVGSFISIQGGTAVDAFFNNFDFASAAGTSPIKCDTSGQVTFDKGGIENMAVGGGTITTPKIFDFVSPCTIKMYDVLWAGFETDNQTYAGTPTFVSIGADNNSVDMQNVTWTQAMNPGSLAMRFLAHSGINTRVALRNNYIYCVLGCSTVTQVQSFFTNGFNVDFGTKFGDISNNLMGGSGLGLPRIWGFKQELGSFSSVQTADAGSGANTVLDTLTLPKNSFWKGRSLTWTGCGKAVGAAGSKTIDFSFNAGGATTYNVATSATAQDWCATVNVYFNKFDVQSVNVNGLTGVTPVNSVTAAAKATDANTSIFSILGTAAGGDSITLTSSSWEMQ